MRQAAPEPVLFVSHSSELRGAEKSLHLLLRHLNRDRIEPIVAMPGKGPLFKRVSDLGLRVYDVPMYWWIPPEGCHSAALRDLRQLLDRARLLLDLIRRRRCRLVHTNSAVVCEGAVAAALAGVPHVWHIREMLDRPDSSLDPLLGAPATVGLISHMSEKVIAVSRAAARQFSGLPNVEVIYNGVDLVRNRPARLPGRAHAIRLAFAGNLTYRKGVDLFVDACLQLDRDDLEFYLAGEPSEPDLARRVQQQVRRSPRANRFHFLGYRDDIANVLEACDLYVLSSRNAPFPRTVIEGMHAGCAVVATDCGGATEAIEACQGGRVVDVGADALAAGISSLLEDPRALRTCGERARANVERKFSAQAYADSVSGLLSAVLKSPRPPRSLDDVLSLIGRLPPPPPARLRLVDRLFHRV